MVFVLRRWESMLKYVVIGAAGKPVNRGIPDSLCSSNDSIRVTK